MEGKRAATAASQVGGECLLWAVRDAAIWTDLRGCCDRSNGGREPIPTDAAFFTKVRFDVGAELNFT
jgi:hypothetical protein